MGEKSFAKLEKIILRRRTTKPTNMNGRQIPDEQIEDLLKLAQWAPTHGRTEPWRFYVFRDGALKNFGQTHADLYWQNTLENDREHGKYDKLLHAVDKVSHLIIAVMKRGRNAKIPVIEEVAAASAAIEHILLGASALDIASMWNSGGMTHHEAMKDYLKLSDEDVVLGLLYLGYTDEPAGKGKRSDWADKVKWME